MDPPGIVGIGLDSRIGAHAALVWTFSIIQAPGNFVFRNPDESHPIPVLHGHNVPSREQDGIQAVVLQFAVSKPEHRSRGVDDPIIGEQHGPFPYRQHAAIIRAAVLRKGWGRGRIRLSLYNERERACDNKQDRR
jgi:hypothetical protein